MLAQVKSVENIQHSLSLLQSLMSDIQWRTAEPTTKTAFCSLRAIVSESQYRFLLQLRDDKKVISFRKKKINALHHPDYPNHYEILIESFDYDGLVAVKKAQEEARLEQRVKELFVGQRLGIAQQIGDVVGRLFEQNAKAQEKMLESKFKGLHESGKEQIEQMQREQRETLQQLYGKNESKIEKMLVKLQNLMQEDVDQGEKILNDLKLGLIKEEDFFDRVGEDLLQIKMQGTSLSEQLALVKDEMIGRFNDLTDMIDDRFKEQHQLFVTEFSTQLDRHHETLQRDIIKAVWGDEMPQSQSFVDYQKALMEAYQMKILEHQDIVEDRMKSFYDDEQIKMVEEQARVLDEQRVKIEVFQASALARQEGFLSGQRSEIKEILTQQQDEISRVLGKHQDKIKDYFQRSDKARDRQEKIIGSFGSALKAHLKSGEKSEEKLVELLSQLQIRVDTDANLFKANFAQREQTVREMRAIFKESQEMTQDSLHVFGKQLSDILVAQRETQEMAKLVAIASSEVNADIISSQREEALEGGARQFYLELLRGLNNAASLFGCLVRGEATTEGNIIKKAGAALGTVGDFVPLPFASLLLGAVGRGIQYAGVLKEKKDAIRFLRFLGDETGNVLDRSILDEAAFCVANDYRQQLIVLNQDSVRELVSVVLETFIKAAIRAEKEKYGETTKERIAALTLKERIAALTLSVRAGSLFDVEKKRLKVDPSQEEPFVASKYKNWTTSGLLKRSGVLVVIEEKEKEFILPKKKGILVLNEECDAHHKYGFHFGTLFEIERAKMIEHRLPVGQPIMQEIDQSDLPTESESDDEVVMKAEKT